MTTKISSPGAYGGQLWHHHATTSSIYPITPHRPLSSRELFCQCREEGGNIHDCFYGSHRLAHEFCDTDRRHRSRLFSHTETGRRLRLFRLIRWLSRRGGGGGRLLETLLSDHNGDHKLLSRLLSGDHKLLSRLLSGDHSRLSDLLEGRGGSRRRRHKCRRFDDLLPPGDLAEILSLFPLLTSLSAYAPTSCAASAPYIVSEATNASAAPLRTTSGFKISAPVTGIFNGAGCSAGGAQTSCGSFVNGGNGFVTNANGFVTNANGFVTNANGFVTNANGFVTNANGGNGTFTSSAPLVGSATPCFSSSVPYATSVASGVAYDPNSALIFQLLRILLRIIRRKLGDRCNFNEHTLLLLLVSWINPTVGLTSAIDFSQLNFLFLEVLRRLVGRCRGRRDGPRFARRLILMLLSILVSRMGASGFPVAPFGNLALGLDAFSGGFGCETSSDESCSDTEDTDDDDDGESSGEEANRPVLEDILSGRDRPPRSRLLRHLMHTDEVDHESARIYYRPRWGHAHEEEEEYEHGEDDDEPSPLAIKDAARFGLNREGARIHGEHNHTYPHPDDLYDGFLNHPSHLNGFQEGPTARDYDCGQGACPPRFLLDHFLVSIENKRGHPYADKITTDYCIEVNGVKGRVLFLKRGCRYEFTFKIFDRCDVVGEDFDKTAAVNEKFLITWDNTGGPGAEPFEWAPKPTPVGTSIWVEVPPHAPPFGFYQLSQTMNCGFIIIFYGGERFKHY